MHPKDLYSLLFRFEIMDYHSIEQLAIWACFLKIAESDGLS